MRLRAADGTTHARGLAFSISLVLVQGPRRRGRPRGGDRLRGISSAAPGHHPGFGSRPHERPPDQRGSAGDACRPPSSLSPAGPRPHRHHRHGHHGDGAARASDESHLRSREGPSVRGEVQACVRARAERRRRDRRGVRAARFRPRPRRPRRVALVLARRPLARRDSARRVRASPCSFAGRRSAGSRAGRGLRSVQGLEWEPGR